jgi:P27 family predicted phage terminase small subunit
VRETPVKPDGLSDVESREWDRLVRTLGPVLSRASEGALVVVVSAYGEFVTADAAIREHGLTYQTHGESGTIIRQRPEVRIRDAARATYLRALLELGGSPVAQARVKKLPDCTTTKDSGLAGLLDPSPEVHRE